MYAINCETQGAGVDMKTDHSLHSDYAMSQKLTFKDFGDTNHPKFC